MEQTNDFTSGKILGPLVKFAMPVLFALCLQAMYGAVDLLVVGQFGDASDVSAVATGSQMMQMVTAIITGLAMGTTILLGQKIGMKRLDEAGDIIGAGICFFAGLALLFTIAICAFAVPFVTFMHAPEEAFTKTVHYVQICSLGSCFIIAYNLLGSIFRGMGDSKTPLFTVLMASIFNVAGDLLFVGAFHMKASGAALATILAQAFSVILCVIVVKRKGLPFPFSRKNIRIHWGIIKDTVKLGFPIALQDGLVSLSFLAIIAIVNDLGVIASAGVGVAEKLCAFIMLVPSAFSQSLSAFVAQNTGAGKPDRAKKSMLCGMGVSFGIGCAMAYVSFFHGNILAEIFSKDQAVILAAADYLKAYAIDTLLVAFLFCFIGYFNGTGKTFFVMLQGIIGAFCVRIPVSFLMSRLTPVSLFHVGLATPCSTIVQISLCILYFVWTVRKENGHKGMEQN